MELVTPPSGREEELYSKIIWPVVGYTSTQILEGCVLQIAKRSYEIVKWGLCFFDIVCFMCWWYTYFFLFWSGFLLNSLNNLYKINFMKHDAVFPSNKFQFGPLLYIQLFSNRVSIACDLVVLNSHFPWKLYCNRLEMLFSRHYRN